MIEILVSKWLELRYFYSPIVINRLVYKGLNPKILFRSYYFVFPKIFLVNRLILCNLKISVFYLNDAWIMDNNLIKWALYHLES